MRSYNTHVLLHAQQRIQDVPPSKFKCDTNSPVGAEVWSNTKPRVSLTHMFCGQIAQNAAQGVHGLPNNAPPLGVVKVEGKCVGFAGMYCWKDTYVWNANAQPRATFVKKVNPPNVKDQLFYPGNIEGTVKYLTTLYNTPSCKALPLQQNQRYCVDVYKNKKLDHVTVFVTTNTPAIDIRTAWPIRPTEKGDNRCTAQNTCRSDL